MSEYENFDAQTGLKEKPGRQRCWSFTFSVFEMRTLSSKELIQDNFKGEKSFRKKKKSKKSLALILSYRANGSYNSLKVNDAILS